MHHPWRRFREELSEWTLLWAALPEGILGVTNFRARTVTLTHGMTQAERRCTIAHESEHMAGERREVVADRNAARLLLPDIRAIGEALAWSHSTHEAAEELWVDEATLRARLDALHPSERHYLRRRLEEID